MNHQTSTNLDSKMEEAIKALGIKNNNLIDMSLLTGFVTLLKNSKENKEVIKLIFELCNSQVKDDAAKDKATTIDIIKNVALLASQKNSAFNEDKLKRRGLNTIRIAVQNVSENLDKKVAIVVCPTKKQEDLSFAAENSHGIVQSLMDIRNVAISRGDMQTDQDATALLTKFLDEIDKASVTLKTMIEDAFAKGHGSYKQLSSYARRIVEDNKKEIKEQILAGKSIEDIAKEIKLSPKSLSLTIAKDLKKSILNSLKKQILDKKDAGSSTEEILKELNLHQSFINIADMNAKLKEWRKVDVPKTPAPAPKKVTEKNVLDKKEIEVLKPEEK